MIPVNGPGDDQAGPVARGADDKNRIARAELVSIVTQNLSRLTDEIGKALKSMGFTGVNGGQVVMTGGGAELAGLAEFAQSALGMPVRIGKPPSLTGLPEAHSTPGFATLAGLCLYAADDPIDIRSVGESRAPISRFGLGLGVGRLMRALKENF